MVSLFHDIHCIPVCFTGYTDARVIEAFQKGETPTFIRHVKAGLQALADDPCGLLVFSGYGLLIFLDTFTLLFVFNRMIFQRTNEER